MSVKYFGPGKHSSGCVGFEVTGERGGKPVVEFFSTSAASEQDISNVVFQHKKLQAELLDATLRAEALEIFYRTFISTTDPQTLPFRGVGVHCIEMNYIKTGTEMRPVFQVIDSKGKRENVGFESLLFSEAWAAAVKKWAAKHEIQEEDVATVLSKPPAPTAFRDLRRQMNDEGANIPVDVISIVFKESREQREQEAVAKKGAQAKLPVAPVLDDAEAGSMLSWLEEQKQLFTKSRQ